MHLRSPLFATVILALLPILIPGCARNRLTIRTTEAIGEVWINGRPTGATEVREPIPDSGTIRVEWIDRLQVLAARDVLLEPPLLWRFPFDLVFEALFPIPRSWEVEVELDRPRPRAEAMRFTRLERALGSMSREIMRDWRIQQALYHHHRLSRETATGNRP